MLVALLQTIKVVYREKDLVSRISAVLVEAAQPRKIILFGLRARGNAETDSYFYLMVVEDRPADRFGEMVRLKRLLR